MLSCAVQPPFPPPPIPDCDVGIEYLGQNRCLEARERFGLALEYGEGQPCAHNGLGLIAMSCENDLDRAAQFFKDAIAYDPNYAPAHNNLGASFLKRHPPRYEPACEEFRAALEIDPEFLDARENLGLCLMRQGILEGTFKRNERQAELFGQAQSQLVRLLEREPTNANARHYLGLMALVESRYEEAESQLARCLELDPINSGCSYNLGTLYLSTGRCERAIESFVGALRPGTESEVAIEARGGLQAAYEQCAKKDGALEVFLARIKSQSGNPVSHFDLANIYKDKGILERAKAEWTAAVVLDPTFCPPYFELAMRAHDELDTQSTIQECASFIRCSNEHRAEPPEKVERCRDLLDTIRER